MQTLTTRFVIYWCYNMVLAYQFAHDRTLGRAEKINWEMRPYGRITG